MAFEFANISFMSLILSSQNIFNIGLKSFRIQFALPVFGLLNPLLLLAAVDVIRLSATFDPILLQ